MRTDGQQEPGEFWDWLAREGMLNLPPKKLRGEKRVDRSLETDDGHYKVSLIAKTDWPTDLDLALLEQWVEAGRIVPRKVVLESLLACGAQRASVPERVDRLSLSALIHYPIQDQQFDSTTISPSRTEVLIQGLVWTSRLGPVPPAKESLAASHPLVGSIDTLTEDLRSVGGGVQLGSLEFARAFLKAQAI